MIPARQANVAALVRQAVLDRVPGGDPAGAEH